MSNIDSEIPKHWRKKKSSTSKSSAKSKHRHEYIYCLSIKPDKTPRKTTYCKVCGKVGGVTFLKQKKLAMEDVEC